MSGFIYKFAKFKRNIPHFRLVSVATHLHK